MAERLSRVATPSEAGPSTPETVGPPTDMEWDESLEAVARRCFAGEEELRRERKGAWRHALARAWTRTRGNARDLAETIGLGWSLLKLGGLWLVLAGLLGSGLLGFGIALGLLALIRLLPARRRMARRLAAFRDGDADATRAVHRFAAEEFRAQVERHRARTLGPESEWGVARASLTKAVASAQGSVAYWRARLNQDPEDPMVAGQLRTATELRPKLRAALAKLDARREVLLRFYADCEARIAVMERHNRDVEQTRRLDRLSDAADGVIAGAGTAAAEVGASFAREAHAVGRVLGSFERLQLESLAGEAPVDDIEFLAERINEASEREFDAVERLSRMIGE